MTNSPTELFEIQWTVYIAAKSKERAMLTMQNLEDIIQIPIQLQKVSQYWRDSSLYEIIFSTPHFETTREDAVYQTLIVANTLAWEWQVRCPGEWHGEFNFGGISTKTKVIGVTWVSFDLISLNSNSVEVEQEQMLLDGPYME